MTIGNVGGGESLDLLAEEGLPEALPEAAKVIQGRSPWRLAYERLRRDRAAVISAFVILVIFACAIGAAVFASITGHGVNQQFRIIGETPEGFPVGPGSKFWLGTDDQGRDVLVRIAYGARVSLLIGVVTSAITVAFGTLMGLMAAVDAGAAAFLAAGAVAFLAAGAAFFAAAGAAALTAFFAGAGVFFAVAMMMILRCSELHSASPRRKEGAQF